jgi:hypothetical protein
VVQRGENVSLAQIAEQRLQQHQQGLGEENRPPDPAQAGQPAQPNLDALGAVGGAGGPGQDLPGNVPNVPTNDQQIGILARSRRVSSADRANNSLSHLFSHLSKPLSETIQVVHRDNPDLIDRSIRHLEKLTPNYCTQALIRDEFTQIVDSKLQILTQYIGTLSTEVKRLRTESKATACLALDKPYLMTPNEESSYGAYCSAENYVKTSGKV